MTSAASAICGTHLGETNDVASIAGSPASVSMSISATLTSVGHHRFLVLQAVARTDLAKAHDTRRSAKGSSCEGFFTCVGRPRNASCAPTAAPVFRLAGAGVHASSSSTRSAPSPTRSPTAKWTATTRRRRARRSCAPFSSPRARPAPRLFRPKSPGFTMTATTVPDIGAVRCPACSASSPACASGSTRDSRARAPGEKHVPNVAVAYDVRGVSRLDIGVHRRVAPRRTAARRACRRAPSAPRRRRRTRRTRPSCGLTVTVRCPRPSSNVNGDPVRRRAIPPRIGSVPRRMRIGSTGGRRAGSVARSPDIRRAPRRSTRDPARHWPAQAARRDARRSVPCRGVRRRMRACATTRSRNATLVRDAGHFALRRRAQQLRGARTLAVFAPRDHLREQRIVEGVTSSPSRKPVSTRTLAARGRHPPDATIRPIDGRKPRSGSSA